MKSLFLLGRIVFGGFFLYNGLHHFQQRKSMAQYTSSKGVPMPEVAVMASGALLLAGGASVLLGIKPKWGTLAIITFLTGVSPVMHDFWKSDDPARKQNDMIHFMKNVAMLGAAMAFMGMDEPWPISVPIGQPSRLKHVKKYVQEMAA
jgi:putative oxidoreductase